MTAAQEAGSARIRPRRVAALALVSALALVGQASVSSAEADVASAPGSLDTSFDGDGKVVTQIGSSTDQGNAVAIQPDGRIVVAGFSQSGTGHRFAVVRYDADGSLDTSFDGDGKVTTAIGTGSRDEAYAVALQPDGKIVVAGDSYTGNDSHFAVVRYNPDGSLDTSFDGDGKVTTVIGVRDFARAVAVQGDGRIVVAGASAPFAGAGGFVALARYNADGSLDTGFNDADRVPTPSGTVVTDVGSSSTAHAVAIRGDGKIVVAGSTRGGASTDVVVVRYGTDGSLDASFGPVGTTQAGIVITEISTGTDVGTALVLLADGRILVAGFSQTGSSFQIAVVRYSGAGGLDHTFDGDGVATTGVGTFSQGFGLAVDGNGGAIVAGQGFTGASRDIALVRYGTDGSLDPAFGSGGIVTTPVGRAMTKREAWRCKPTGGSSWPASATTGSTRTMWSSPATTAIRRPPTC